MRLLDSIIVLILEGQQQSNDSFISKSKQIYGDKYSYEKSNYTKAHNPITVTCPKHGDFTKKAYSFLNGSGCPKCGIESRAKKASIGIDSFINRAKDVHGDKYDYSKVVYTNSNTPVEIICPIHGSFFQSSSSHISQKANCPKCLGKTTDTETFIKNSEKVHGNQYDYSLVNYKNSKTPVEIICPIHGEFKQTPNSHLNGAGCQECAGNVQYDNKTFIEKSKSVHGDKYDYSLVDYNNINTPVKIICPIHGEFYQKPGKHLIGQGCPECGKGMNKYNTDTFIKLSKEKHGDKYSYNNTNYTGSLDYVTITCPKHGDFSQIAIEHRRGSGCSRCLESKGETFIGNILDAENISYIRQKKFEDCKGVHKKICRRLPFDFYLPDYNTLIEYDGEQHYRPIDLFGGEESFKKIQINDNIKNEYSKRNNFKMIRIPYSLDFLKIRDYILNNLKN